MEPMGLGEVRQGEAAGGEDDGQVHAGGLEFPEELNAGDPWHVLVGDNEVITVGVEGLPGGGAVLGGVDVVAKVDEDFGAELPDGSPSSTTRMRRAGVAWDCAAVPGHARGRSW